MLPSVSLAVHLITVLLNIRKEFNCTCVSLHEEKMLLDLMKEICRHNSVSLNCKKICRFTGTVLSAHFSLYWNYKAERFR